MELNNLKLVVGVKYVKCCVGCGIGLGFGKMVGCGYKG